MLRIGIVANEPSGDLLGARLMRAIGERVQDVQFEGIGFWLRGDANGGQFKLQLRDKAGAVDYYIKNDFRGWRYQQLARPAKDSIDYTNVRRLLFYYNQLPAKTTVSCAIDDVKALPALDDRALRNPYIELARKRLAVDAALTEGQFLIVWPNESAKTYGPPLQAPRSCPMPADSAILPQGKHKVRFGCDSPLRMTARVRLTLQLPEQHLIKP